MSNAANITDPVEFPFMDGLPKREVKRVHSVWDKWAELKAVMAAKGALIPITFAAELGGVSRQRIYQLVEAGKLQHVEVGNCGFIAEESFMAWVSSERKTGRPPAPVPASIAGRALRSAQIAGRWAKEKAEKA